MTQIQLNSTITRLISLLFKLGDKGPSQAYEQVTAVLEKEYQSNKLDVLEAFKICILQVPHKISFYATLTGLLNVKNGQIAQDLVDLAFEEMSAGLQNHDFMSVKFYMRYLADLMNVHVVNPIHFMTLLETLTSVLYDPSVPFCKSDAYIYSVLMCLPWGGKVLASESSTSHDFTKLMTNIEAHIKSRVSMKQQVGVDKALKCTSVYHLSLTQDPSQLYAPLDMLELLWAQIQHLESQKWENSILQKPYKMFDSLFPQAIYQSLPAYSIPTELSSVKFYYQSKFWIFDDSISSHIAQVPKMFTVERLLLDDMIHDTIRIYALNHRECTRLLLSLVSFLNPTFVEKYAIHQSIVEVLFSEMFRFPRPTEKTVYYSTLLMELCKNALDKVPSAMGRALKILFSRLEGSFGSMDIESVKRLVEWFAHHLSNFGYAWKWNEWSFILKEPNHSLGKIFIKETLLRCIRLSYYERIRNSVPHEYFDSETGLLPNSEPSFHYQYATLESCGNDAELFEMASQLSGMIAKRVDKDHLMSFITDIHAKAEGKSQMQVREWDLGREIFLESLFFNGSKSFSHLLSLVEKYLLILLEMNMSLEQKLWTIQIAFQFWANHSQFFEITLDKFMNYRILDPQSIVTWILSPSIMDHHYSEFLILSILKMTLNKVLLKVGQLQSKLQHARATHEEDRMDQDEEETVPALESSLEAANREQKEIFILVLQKFTYLLSDKLESDPGIVSSPWWKWVSESMREIGRAFEKQLMPLKVTIEAILFDDNHVPAPIVEIWQEMKAMDALHDSHFV